MSWKVPHISYLLTSFVFLLLLLFFSNQKWMLNLPEDFLATIEMTFSLLIYDVL